MGGWRSLIGGGGIAQAVNGNSTLSFTITNPNSTLGLTGVAFSDTFPAGLVVASTPNPTNTCGGTFTTTASSSSVGLTGGLIGAGGSCTLSVSVKGTTSGVKSNTTGAVSSTEGGTGTTSNTANLTVASPATISKAFSPTSIVVAASSVLSFSIHNPNPAIALSGISFSDPLPSGVQVASSPGATNTCGGTFSAAANSTTVSLSGGSLASSASCTLSVKVTGATFGVKNNTTGVISSTQGGTGTTSNTATLTVIAPPTIQKFFGAPSIPLNGSTSLGFTISNPNSTTTLTHIQFSDNLPTGLLVSTPNGLTGSCGGGSISATSGGKVISLSGATLAANASCTFSVKVTGTTAGAKNNVTSAITSNECQSGGTASASITVVKPPALIKAFGTSSIGLNASTKLSFTLTNPAVNTVALTGVAFTDTLPAGLVISTPNGLTGSCGGTITANAGSGTVSLSGATVNTSSSCTFVVKVTGTTTGSKVNVTSPVTSANGGTGNTATAMLSVTASGPSITTQPANQTVCEQTSVSFTAAASGAPTPTVQWQVSTNGGGTWNNISGATSTTLTFVAVSTENGNKYRAVFTNTGPATTNAATLTVNTDPKIATSPGNQTVAAGNTATFTAAASGSPAPTVQWQSSTNGGGSWSNISGATSTTLTFQATAAKNHSQYRAVFKNGCGTATTQAATLTVD